MSGPACWPRQVEQRPSDRAIDLDTEVVIGRERTSARLFWGIALSAIPIACDGREKFCKADEGKSALVPWEI
jgi:hypothetical protein